MQTFLPVPDFWGSATLLDRQRLGKQRLENMQIMKALVTPEDSTPSIIKHWVTALWRGHESWLMGYQSEVCAEWVSRGYKDTCFEKTHELYKASGYRRDPKPPWLGEDEFHAQHRARLVAKAPEFYGPLFPGTDPIDDYTFRWRQ